MQQCAARAEKITSSYLSLRSQSAEEAHLCGSSIKLVRLASGSREMLHRSLRSRAPLLARWLLLLLLLVRRSSLKKSYVAFGAEGWEPPLPDRCYASPKGRGASQLASDFHGVRPRQGAGTSRAMRAALCWQRRAAQAQRWAGISTSPARAGLSEPLAGVGRNSARRRQRVAPSAAGPKGPAHLAKVSNHRPSRAEQRSNDLVGLLRSPGPWARLSASPS